MSILFATQTAAGEPIVFKFVRGTPWSDDFQLVEQATSEPIDLTGIEGLLMRVRTRTGASTVVYELSTANDTLVVNDAATGMVGIRLNSAQTNTFPANGHRKGKYVYDVLIERTPGEFEPAIGGKITVLPQVSRPLDDA